MNIKQENHLRHIHPVRHAKHPKQILQTKHTFTTTLRGRQFDSAEEGGIWQFMWSQNILRATMDAGLFIYFPRDPGQNIYFKVFGARGYLF